MEETKRIPIYTIGYGNRSITQFIDTLNQYQIEFVIDVRSKPYSRFNPDFTKDALEKHLRKHSIRYVFMGDTLGGRPADKTCYTEDATADEKHVIGDDRGDDREDDIADEQIEAKEKDKKLFVDYTKLREKPFFQEGIARLHIAWEKQLKVAVMCSELKPENCHRSKLIGNTLLENGIDVSHIDETGNWKDQEAVKNIILGESSIQLSLSWEQSEKQSIENKNKNMNRSKKKY